MDTLRMKRLSVVAAVVLILMMVLPRGGSALEASISPLASCVPDCSGMTDGAQVVDPLNCTNYYICMSGQPLSHPNNCGTDSQFDPEALECVRWGGCEPVCGGGGSGCTITCDETTRLVSNPFDCHTYYICDPTVPLLVPCSDDYPYFDGTDCTNDNTFCCSPYCGVNCDGSAFAAVPDPEDCASFYVCQGVEGNPGPDFKYSCGLGMYFNIPLGKCVTGDSTSCITLCDAATGSTPSTGDCVSSFTCTAAGDFPACQTCQPQYFHCASAGVAGVFDTCPDDNVFNPTPDLGFCVMPSNCPFT